MGSKLLFVGYAVSVKECFSTPGSSPAANRYQLGLLGGIHQFVGSNLEAITRMPIAPAKISKRSYIQRETKELFPGLSTTILPMLNFPFVKQLWSAIHATIEIRRWSRRQQQTDTRIIVGYNLNSFLGIAVSAVSVATKSKYIYIFTDPPYTNTKKGIIWNVAYRVNSAMTRYTIGKSTGIVTVNAGVVNRFAPGKPFCVLEGGIDANTVNADASNDVKSKTLVYSGGLSPHNGLENLIDGFLLTQDEEYKLLIYGRGILDKSLKERASHDKRIEFPGFVPSEEMTEIQRSAAVLVNPRPASLEISKTTFPSKLMEYLASGRPVLTTHLPGITPEYNPYFSFVEDESAQGFAGAINRILCMPEEESARVGREGQRFVLENKNWNSQAELFLRFVGMLVGGPAA